MTTNKPRKWWIAGLLSILYPGLGQIYNGQARKGILIFALPFLILPGLLLCFDNKFLFFFLISYLLLTIAYYLLVITDAIRTARKFQDDYCLKKYNKTLVYIAVIVISVIINTIITESVKNNYLKAYKIPAGSMKPTLLIGDHILVNRQPSARTPNRGDIIVFEFPEDPEKDFIKRVAAVGGDTVEIRDKQLFVNGKSVEESYIIHDDSKIVSASPRDNLGAVKVPDSSYFVLGDNRDNSYDSRFWGVVEKAKIRGSAKIIYWSWNSKTNSVRWERIGKKIE